MSFKNWRDVQITVSDGDSPVNSEVLVFDTDANVNIPGVVVNFLRDRGALPSAPEVTKGDEGEMDGGWSLRPEDLFNAGAAIAAALALQGLPTGWVSTLTEADAFDIAITDGTDTMTFPDSIVRGNWSDGGDGGEAQEIAYTFRTPHMYPTLS